MAAFIKAIEYELPNGQLTNQELAYEFPEWSVEKIEQKTGIRIRRVSAENECASDLGVRAVEKLFSSGVCDREQIDYLLLCTQSPDFLLPSTSCIMQDRLRLRKTCGALDFNLGCSGYVYGLGLAKGLVETGQAENVLLITAETYSKHIHQGDKSVRTLFGDAAAATLIQSNSSGESKTYIGPFVYGTDGSGSSNLIIPAGGMRLPCSVETSITIEDANGNTRSLDNLYMNGSEIFTFTLNAVPKAINKLLLAANRNLGEIDLFVFHQANKFMLDYLRKKIRIDNEKFYVSFKNYGNTVSSTIPLALKDAYLDNKLHKDDLVMIVGFGVGYSWAATLVRWVV
ncbi:ketoacyl-ACP synthase III [Desulfofustis glycolicus]|uniref:3-oxoacyl-[acyl-carrier-protein] synthase-3 n=1 Tax=Desulfofustis glycolicus DSM 9705 TaxID=1121409 RepID=A0A1M5VQ06_9BACT|nr:ketoacyl-ACP synthase III [Desulfofustis glycolicus]SHH77270.1 3-oxoacyl-[acyl-carrier-protein] synthase-3 [Desulfofustis glycolicus DSM 9705]